MIFDACSHSCFFLLLLFPWFVLLFAIFGVSMFLCETFCYFLHRFCVSCRIYTFRSHFIERITSQTNISIENQVEFQCFIPIKSNYNIYCFISILNHKNKTEIETICKQATQLKHRFNIIQAIEMSNPNPFHMEQTGSIIQPATLMENVMQNAVKRQRHILNGRESSRCTNGWD